MESNKAVTVGVAHELAQVIDENFLNIHYKTFPRASKLIILIGLTALFLLGTVSPTASAKQIDLGIISQIESSNRPSAVGDDGRSLGLFQLSKWPVLEYNKANGTRHDHSEALEPTTARKIADWYLHIRIPQMLGKRDSVRNRLIAYNCGISCLNRPRLPKTTELYLKKYKLLGGHA